MLRVVALVSWTLASWPPLAGCADPPRVATPADAPDALAPLDASTADLARPHRGQPDAAEDAAEDAPTVRDSARPSCEDSDGDGVCDSRDGCDGRRLGDQLLYGESLADDLAAVHDVADTLGRLVGGPFEREPAGFYRGECHTQGTALYLLTLGDAWLAHAPPAVQARLAEVEAGSRSTYALVSLPGRGIWVVGRSRPATLHGAYDLLDRYGVRWWLPGPAWTLEPAREDLRLALDEVRAPVFERALVTPNGGVGNSSAVRPLPWDSYVERWEAWLRRNRFTRGYGVFGGHAVFAGSPDAEALAQSLQDSPVRMAERTFATGERGPFEAHTVKLHATHHGTVSCRDPAALIYDNTLDPAPGQLGLDALDQDLDCGADDTQRLLRSYVVATGCTSDAECGEGECEAGACAYCEDPCDYGTWEGAVADFVDWKLDAFTASGGSAPKPNDYWTTVSVEQSDGGGYCHCWKCRNLLTHGPHGPLEGSYDASDGVHHLTNLAAQRLRETHGDQVHASVFAYASHIRPPTLPIEPNTRVMLVPYGFNYVDTPDALIARWSDKRATNPLGPFRLAIYDYWCLTEWHYDEPRCGAWRMGERAAGWASHGFSDVQWETSAGGGAAGFPLWLASRIGWDGALDPSATFEQSLAAAFGAALAPVRRMLARWDARFLLTKHELGLTFADLAEATELAAQAGQGAVLARLDDLKRYAHYLRLRFELEFPVAGDPPYVERLEALVAHMWRVWDSMMVASYRLHGLLRSRSKARFSSHAEWAAFWGDPNQPPTGADRWDLRVPTAPGFAELTPLAQPELDALMSEGAATHPPLPVELTTYEGPLEALYPPSSKTTLVEIPATNGTDHYAFEVREGGPPLTFEIATLNANKAVAAPHQLTVFDPAGEAVFHESFEVAGKMQTFTFELGALAPGIYVLRAACFDPSSRLTLRVPRALHLSLRGALRRYALVKRYFFLVPAGVEEVVFYWLGKGVPLPEIEVEGEGPAAGVSVIPAPYGGNLWRAEVPEGADGAVWSINSLATITREGLMLLNVPSAFALAPDMLLVPADALP